MAGGKSFIDLTANIVSAYLSHKYDAGPRKIPALISQIHAALLRGLDRSNRSAAGNRRNPAVSVKKSMTPDYLVCLEDGKRFKSLEAPFAHAIQA